MSGGSRTGYAFARAGGWRRCAAAWLACLTVGGSCAVAAAAENPAEASISHAARQEAASAIPLAKIDAKFQQQVREVLLDPSIFRRLPTNVVDCRPELFTYLAQNPEVLVEIW